MATGTFYLNSTGTLGGDGSGRNAQNPVNCSTQALLDAWYAANLNNDISGGTYAGALNIIYSAGTFQTLGWKFSTRQTVYSGNQHIGAGIGNTIIQLTGAAATTADGVIFARDQPSGISSPTNTIQNWGCNGITFDCAATSQPKWASPGGAVNAIITPAGSNIVIQNCKFINWGTSLLGSEAFPCAIQGASGQQNFLMQDCLIDSCIFSNPVSGNKDGVSCATIFGLPSGNVTMDSSNVVSNCQFTNCWNATANQPGDFSYQHCSAAPTVRKNQCTGCDVFYYQEPNGQFFFDMLCEGNDASCRRLFFVAYHGGSQIGKIICRNNRMVFTSDSTINNAGFQLNGNGSSPKGITGSIEVYGNVFLAANAVDTGITITGSPSTPDVYTSSVNVYSNRLSNFVPGKALIFDNRIDVIGSLSQRDNIVD